MKSQSAIEKACLIGALLSVVILYGPLVRYDPILTRDDHSLIDPLRVVHGPGDYLHARAEHRILDLQPVRDASFLLDLGLSRMLGFGTFHATNLVIWIAILLVLRSLLGLISAQPALNGACLLLFAVHPVFVGSVGWISARKHLLACLFILGATAVWERRRKGLLRGRELLAVVLLYLAAVLSQPIIVLWPLWATFSLLLDRQKDRKLWSTVAICCVLMLGGLALNYAYYTGDYQDATPVSKFAQGHHLVGALALGRYVANLCWPLHLSTLYAPGSRWEPVGLVLFGLLFAASFLFIRDRREAARWLAFFLFPLVLVTVRMTNIFVSDTYLLTASVGVLCLLVLMLDSVVARIPAVAILGVIAAAILWPIASAQARTWRSDAALWAQAWHEEPTPATAAKHAFHLARGGQREEARAVLATIPWDEMVGEVGQVAAQVVYEDRRLSAGEKEGQLNRLPASPWRNYYLAAILAGRGAFPESWRLMQEAFADHPRFGADLPTITAESVWFCRSAGASDCAALAEAQRHERGWDEAAYARRAAALSGQP